MLVNENGHHVGFWAVIEPMSCFDILRPTQAIHAVAFPILSLILFFIMIYPEFVTPANANPRITLLDSTDVPEQCNGGLWPAQRRAHLNGTP